MPPYHSLRKATTTTKLGRFGMQIMPTAKGSSSLPTSLHPPLLLLLLLVIRPSKVVADDGKKLTTPPSSGAAPQLLSQAHFRAGEHSHSGNRHHTPPSHTPAAAKLPPNFTCYNPVRREGDHICRGAASPHKTPKQDCDDPPC
ncbi:hypothetical protein ACQJBY_019849 [Aegilops geniculata]